MPVDRNPWAGLAQAPALGFGLPLGPLNPVQHTVDPGQASEHVRQAIAAPLCWSGALQRPMIGRHVSVHAALRWLGMPEADAQRLVESGKAKGTPDHVVRFAAEPGGPVVVLIRRMKGNHADLYALASDWRAD